MERLACKVPATNLSGVKWGLPSPASTFICQTLILGHRPLQTPPRLTLALSRLLSSSAKGDCMLCWFAVPAGGDPSTYSFCNGSQHMVMMTVVALAWKTLWAGLQDVISGAPPPGIKKGPLEVKRQQRRLDEL